MQVEQATLRARGLGERAYREKFQNLTLTTHPKRIQSLFPRWLVSHLRMIGIRPEVGVHQLPPLRPVATSLRLNRNEYGVDLR